MEKGFILGWLATLHWRREHANLIFPNLPALASLIEHSNSKDWTEQHYKEMDYLGRMTGLLFEDYLSAIRAPIAIPDSVRSNPIIVEEDDDEDLANYNRPGRAPPVRRRTETGDGGVKSDLFPFTIFDFSDDETSDAQSGGGSGSVSATTASTTFVSAVSTDVKGSTAESAGISSQAPARTASESLTADGPNFRTAAMDVDTEGSSVG